ncbi:MAG: branched-chain amino acid transporter substrate-binding protein [Hyphomicrobiales bacterium]|jgi:branched-chain amino acid transport system ATP-binding protein|nr:branched-chain amino acid transporter substrate-binding protein [Hyphomicrobiales bacterium]
MSPPVLQIEALSKRFGGLLVTDDVTLDVGAAEIHALIGPNGAGKSTLIGQVMGEIEPDSGTILLEGQDLSRLSQASRVRRGLARTFQVPEVLGEYGARDNVLAALLAHRRTRPLVNPRHDRALAEEADGFLLRAGLAGRGDVRVADLAHGERKLLELAVALATMPRVLLLDEPMAGLGPGESAQMIEVLRSLRGEVAMLLVEHDMNAVFALADRISVLVYGRVIACGSAEDIQRDPVVRSAYLGTEEA